LFWLAAAPDGPLERAAIRAQEAYQAPNERDHLNRQTRLRCAAVPRRSAYFRRDIIPKLGERHRQGVSFDVKEGGAGAAAATAPADRPVFTARADAPAMKSARSGSPARRCTP
jgi:hypothetical protein